MSIFRKREEQQATIEEEQVICDGCKALIAGKINPVRVITVLGHDAMSVCFASGLRRGGPRTTEKDHFYCGKCRKPYCLLIKVGKDKGYYSFAFKSAGYDHYGRESFKQVKLGAEDEQN